jgi:aminoglycoside phosphotransferase (APT) family kinase protein
MTTIKELTTRLEGWLTEKLGHPVRLNEVRQLAGGASRDTWALDAIISSGPEAGQHPLVLRRDLGGEIDDLALSRKQEFQLLEVAHEQQVRVPRPRWLCMEAEVLGTPFFVMDRLEGEAVGRRVVRLPELAEARQHLPRQMGEQLARIHRIRIDDPRLGSLPGPDAGTSPVHTTLNRFAGQLREAQEPHPVLDLAIRWLRQRPPDCPELVLVHGDFRIGNLMVGREGLRGVFDWEFAHLGDPHEDLAWPCVRSWRFGQEDRPLGGVGDLAPFLEAYEQGTGRTVDRQAVRYWEILGNLRWAVGCIRQTQRHLKGLAPSVELASLGRRTAEMERELLDLIDRREPQKGERTDG